VPTPEKLVEIETTSRLRNKRDTLYMTAPLLYAADDEPWVLVSEKVLLTARSSKLVALRAGRSYAGRCQDGIPSFKLDRPPFLVMLALNVTISLLAGERPAC
jgi:hypothetical protein